jgi:hypothetical protein
VDASELDSQAALAKLGQAELEASGCGTSRRGAARILQFGF